MQLIFLPERNLVLSLKKQGADNLGQGITKAITESGKICAPPGEDAKERSVSVFVSFSFCLSCADDVGHFGAEGGWSERCSRSVLRSRASSTSRRATESSRSTRSRPFPSSSPPSTTSWVRTRVCGHVSCSGSSPRGVNTGERFIFAKGTAVAFARSTFALPPPEFEIDVAAVAIDVASCLSQIERAATTGTMVVIGLGKLGLTAMCFLRKVVPTARIIAIDKDDARLDAARALKKADIVQKMYDSNHLCVCCALAGSDRFVNQRVTNRNARNSAEVLSFVRQSSKGGADVVLHCTRAVGLESSAILSAKRGGSVLFCRQNADPGRVSLLAPSNEVSLVTTGTHPGLSLSPLASTAD